MGEKEKAEMLARWYEEIAKERVPINDRNEEIERAYEEVIKMKSQIRFEKNNNSVRKSSQEEKRWKQLGEE